MDDGVDGFHSRVERTGVPEVASYGGGADGQVEVCSHKRAAIEPRCGETGQHS
jgi:hypothetical protein